MRMIDTLAKKGDAMMANSIRARKGILRDRCRDLRKEMDMDYLRDASDAITKHILASEAYRVAGTIFVYMSYGKEVITDGFIAQALADGKKSASRCVFRRIRWKRSATPDRRISIPESTESESHGRMQRQ